jgi:hypothetical protein
MASWSRSRSSRSSLTIACRFMNGIVAQQVVYPMCVNAAAATIYRSILNPIFNLT